MSTLKKAAVLGAVAYGSYQIGKMSNGYGGWNNHPRGQFYKFESSNIFSSPGLILEIKYFMVPQKPFEKSW